jgi:hypothetical protein
VAVIANPLARSGGHINFSSENEYLQMETGADFFYENGSSQQQTSTCLTLQTSSEEKSNAGIVSPTNSRKKYNANV